MKFKEEHFKQMCAIFSECKNKKDEAIELEY